MISSIEPGFYPRAETCGGATILFGRKVNGVDALACFENWEKSYKTMLKEMWITIVSDDEPERRVFVKRKYELED